MLRLQKGKVPQHQFVTESCGTELAVATKHRERERKEREGVCVCVVCVWPTLRAVYCYIPTGSQQQQGERRIYFSGVSGLNEGRRRKGRECERRERAGFVTRSVSREE